MSMATLGGLMFRILFMAALGFGMRKWGIINDEIQKGLSAMMLMVVVPMSALAAGNNSYSRQMAANLLWAGAITLGLYALTIAVALAARRFVKGLPGPNRNLLANLVVLGNVGYIGFPIIREIYGDEGFLYAVVLNLAFQLVAYTLGIKLAGGELTLKSVFTQPLTVASILSILIFASPFRLPAFVVVAFNEVGALSAPFAMFVIGSALGKLRLSSVFTQKYAWMAFILRQIVLPLAVGGALYALGFGGKLASVMVVLAGMPPATMNVIFAEQFGGDGAFTTRAVMLGTLLMALTLPAQVLLGQFLFPPSA